MSRLPRAFAAAGLAAAAPSLAGPRPVPPSYVGLVHPPTPAGVGEVTGALVTPGDAPGPVFGIMHVRTAGAERLWLDSATSGRTARRPTWRVVDDVRLPPVPRGFSVVLQACRVRGAPDPAVVAVARDEDAEVLRHIRVAWRADLVSRKLRAVDVRGITCDNEGAGL